MEVLKEEISPALQLHPHISRIQKGENSLAFKTCFYWSSCVLVLINRWHCAITELSPFATKVEWAFAHEVKRDGSAPQLFVTTWRETSRVTQQSVPVCLLFAGHTTLNTVNYSCPCWHWDLDQVYTVTLIPTVPKNVDDTAKAGKRLYGHS